MGLRRTSSVQLLLCPTTTIATATEEQRSANILILDENHEPVPEEAQCRDASPTARNSKKPKTADHQLLVRGHHIQSARTTRRSTEVSSVAAGAVARGTNKSAVSGTGRDRDSRSGGAANEERGTGMAPALTEPTAVPPAAKNSDASTSPQPEIFISSPTSATSSNDHHSESQEAPDAVNSNSNPANNSSSNNSNGSKNKNSKKDEFPFKELRSSRRRSQIVPHEGINNSSGVPAVALNGKSGRPKTNGLKGPSKSMDTAKVGAEKSLRSSVTLTSEEVVNDLATASVEAEQRGVPEEVENKVEEARERTGGAVRKGSGCDNKLRLRDSQVVLVDVTKLNPLPEELRENNLVVRTEATVNAMSPKEDKHVADGENNNNNYLDENRIPIVTNTSTSNSCNSSGNDNNSNKIGDPPAIVEQHKKGVEQQQQQQQHQSVATIDGVDQSAEVTAVAATKEMVSSVVPPGPDVITSKDDPLFDLELAASFMQLHNEDASKVGGAVAGACGKSMDAMLDQIVLSTPTKKLAEQLCTLVKDQQNVLEQQEQQQNLVTSSTSNTSGLGTTPVKSQSQSQNSDHNTVEVDDMLGEIDLLQVIKSLETTTATGQEAGEGNLLSLLNVDDDVDMLVSSTSNVAPSKMDHGSDGVCDQEATLTKGGLRPGTQFDCHKMDVDREQHQAGRKSDFEEDEEERQERLDIIARKEMLEEMEKRLSQMQRKHDFLLRRLRKAQVHHVGRHVAEEVMGLFDVAHRSATSTAVGAAAPIKNYNKMKYLKVYKKEDEVPGATAASPLSNVPLNVDSAGLVRADSPPFPAIKPTGVPMNMHQHTSTPVQAANASGGQAARALPISPAMLRAFVNRMAAQGMVTLAPSGVGGSPRKSPQQQQNATSVNLINANNNNYNVTSSSGNNSYNSGSGSNMMSTVVMLNGSGGGSVSTAAGGGVIGGSGILNDAKTTATTTVTLDEQQRNQLDHTAGLLKTELRIVEQAIDSEATASSSGGESVDELINYTNYRQESLPISKRAAWQWAQDRAGVASRWNWLLAEISDLEYRIRQHTELHNQIRKTKGPVLLLTTGGATVATVASPIKGHCSPINVSTATTSVTTAAALTAATALPAKSTTVTLNVNGYRGLLPGNSIYTSPVASKLCDNGAGQDGFMADVEDDGMSCRTRPYQRSAFKKRKLVQTMNLHTISKKAARPSTVKCGCQWPQQPCAICTGRQDPTAPRSLPDMIPKLQRVALLDPGVHPYLSFTEDVSQSIHSEAVMWMPEWQTKVMRSSKSLSKAGGASGGLLKAGGNAKSSKKGLSEDGKKANKKITQGFKKKKNRSMSTKYAQLMKQQKNRKASLKSQLSTMSAYSAASGGMGGSNVADMYEYDVSGRSRTTSPTLASNYYRHERIGHSERRSRHSYDIDNIVIPYSVAASTRVELLPYKEIPTPKWKIVDETDLDEEIQTEANHYQQQQQQSASSDSNSSTITALEFDSEEYIEELISDKHGRALQEERKKFSTFLKFPYSTRSRANRRIDSRAESSGANTPDPTSPLPHTPCIGGDHESIPSPSCPSTPAPDILGDGESSMQGPASVTCQPPIYPAPIGRLTSERRRTTSLKMLTHQSSVASSIDSAVATPTSLRPRSLTPEPPGPLFETLIFPLPDEVYDDMLKQMPENHENIENYLKPPYDLLDEVPSATTEPTTATGAAVTDTGGGAGNSVIAGGNGDMDEANGVDAITAAAAPGTIINLNDPNVVLLTGDDDMATYPPTEHEEDESHQRIIAGGQGEADSDTDTIGSGMLEEDPNDPEWVKS